MDEDTSRIYNGITRSYAEWERLPETPHLLCPKVNDDDDEDYANEGPPTTGISAEEKQQRIQDARRRKEVTYDLALLLGISKEQSGGWLDEWTQRTESFLTKCDGCILGYHMHRKAFLKKLRECVASTDWLTYSLPLTDVQDF